MKLINVTIKGTLPLLQHNPQSAQITPPAKGTQGKKPEDDPSSFLYKNADGVICQPSEHLYQAITKRLSNFKIGGRGKKTYKELGMGTINVVPDMIPHKYQKWIPDARTVVVPSTRGRIMRIRPRFEQWELDFQIQVRSDEMPVDVIHECLKIAGEQGGIGDYRQRYGRFEVVKFEEN